MIFFVVAILLLVALHRIDPVRSAANYYHETEGHAMPTKNVYGSWLIRFLPFMPDDGMTLPGRRRGSVLTLFRRKRGVVRLRDVIHESSHGDTLIRLELAGELQSPRLISWIRYQREHGKVDEQKAQSREKAHISNRPLPAPDIQLDQQVYIDCPDNRGENK